MITTESSSFRFFDFVGSRPGVPFLWAGFVAGVLPVPAPAGVGQPRRPRGPPPSRLRGARRRRWLRQSFRRPRRSSLPPQRPRISVQGSRRPLRQEEEAQAASESER